MSSADSATTTAPAATVAPRFLYGTAWKEERTQALVDEALAAGFRGIDTANQRKHYFEAGVGAALAAAMPRLGIDRDALFLQTKFTYVEGQDARLPYDPTSDLPTQVRQSFASSLAHLGVETLDSFLLHGPRTWTGLSRDDLEVWRTMEELQRDGRARWIGVSNVTAEQLTALCRHAEVRPSFVQNRCFARLGWDRDVRAVCRGEGVVYQGFSLLTANRAELASRTVGAIAERLGATRAQVIFRFALALGMVCLTGTTDPRHMREALAAADLELSAKEIEAVERISG